MPHPDDLSLHFHVDAALLQRTRALHLHVHLRGAAGAGVGLRGDDSGVSYAVTIGHPTHHDVVKVKSTATITTGVDEGVICAYGEAADAEGNQWRQVKGLVYPGGLPAVIPSTPPAGAVNARRVNLSDINYVIDEVPTAEANADGTRENGLVVWATYLQPGVWDKSVVTFFGKIADETECSGGVPIPSACGGAKTMAAAYPKRYRLRFNKPASGKPSSKSIPLADGPVTLKRNPKSAKGLVAEWLGRGKDSTNYRLTITEIAGVTTGTLFAMQSSPEQRPLDYVWQRPEWEPMRANRLLPASPAELQAAGITCQIEPA